MPRGNFLSESEKASIAILNKRGESNRKIAKEIHRSECVVRNFLKMKENYGKKCSTKGNSRITKREKNIIFYEATKNRLVASQIVAKMQLPITKRRVQQILHNNSNIGFKKPEKKPMLKAHHKDNARPHTSIVTRQKLQELGWEVLMHPPYSPDLAPSDYHLFLALQNFFSDKKLASREECENQLLEFFANKDQDFYERGIMKLPLKWQQIIEQNALKEKIKRCWEEIPITITNNLINSMPSRIFALIQNNGGHTKY
ncbi:Mariner Mos1 transposase [Anthophora plagiata]